jgi:hypothetical protein
MVASKKYLLFYWIAQGHFDYSGSSHHFFPIVFVFATDVSIHEKKFPSTPQPKNEKKG